MCVYDLAGVMSSMTMSVGQAAAGAPMSATVKVLGPTTIMKQVKETSSAVGSVLPSRTATAVVSLQPVLIRPGAAMTVASAAPSSSQTSTIQPSLVGASRTGTGLVAASSAVSAASSVQPLLPADVQQTVQDIVQQAQAQAARQNTVGGFVTTSTASVPQQAPPPSVSPVTTVVTSPDAAATAAAAAAGTPPSKSSPYVMRLRNQRS